VTKLAGSGSISQMHGSADPDPYQNVMRNTDGMPVFLSAVSDTVQDIRLFCSIADYRSPDGRCFNVIPV